MNTQKYLREIKEKISTLDSYVENEERLLFRLALGISSAQLFLLDTLSKEQVEKIERVVKRRMKNEPLTKIFNSVEFMGYDFYVNKDVLSPRKETELLVELAIKSAQERLLKNGHNQNKVKVLDMCCGSGCIGLAIKKILKDATDVTLADLSSDALKVAKRNAKNESVKIIKTDMFQDLKKDERFDIIVCNPPYISKDEYENLSSSVKDYDPKMALVGGENGLKFYKILEEQGGKYLTPRGEIIMEIGYNEREDVQKLFKNAGFKTVAYKDFSGLDRVVVAKNYGE